MVSEVESLGKWASHPEISTTVSAAQPDRAEKEARRLIADGCSVLVSWGIAGGLDPSLHTGQIIEPHEVLFPDGNGFGIEHGRVEDGATLGSDVLVLSPNEKARLWQQTTAVALDMESHRIAKAADGTSVSVRIVRAISDPAERALPEIAAKALGADGKPRLMRVIAAISLRPSQVPALISAGRDSRIALHALRERADTFFPALISTLPTGS